MNIPNDTELVTDAGYTILATIGNDGLPVVFIDTPDMDENVKGPLCRIYLNDYAIHDNEVDQ